MVSEPQISVVGAAWDERAERDVQAIRALDPLDLSDMRQKVERGAATLFAVNVDGERAGSLILSWQDSPRGRVIYCEALAAESGTCGHIVPTLIEMIAEWAKAQGAAMLRFETARDGLMKICEANGFSRFYVMERALS